MALLPNPPYPRLLNRRYHKTLPLPLETGDAKKMLTLESVEEMAPEKRKSVTVCEPTSSPACSCVYFATGQPWGLIVPSPYGKKKHLSPALGDRLLLGTRRK